ncbi:olfactory receptor 6M1-like [Rhinatrema bivittatum]|uniref:olfactory receptor 6M1-like n=1 Tax=Rhinatrema bivittatum TaxID=194408 RepID=UPI00112826E6|nr:olfactory receptor 6M1-like [Rhinatrema bivittatum]
MGNHSTQTIFHLLGFSIAPELQALLFFIFISIYILTVSANITIIMLVRVDHRLHAPMYLFLGHLSFLEIWYTSTIVPKLLANLMQNKIISLSGCLAQIYFYFSLGSTEFFLLGVMAVDRYLAICNPLRYTTIMNGRVCLQATTACWSVAFVAVFFLVILISQLPFCGTDVNHFFCDIPPLLKLCCQDTQVVEKVVFLFACSIILSSFLVTIISYFFIVSTILKIPSNKGRRKAFSTCASHFTVVVILYGTVIFIYVRPSVASPLNINKVLGLFNTVVTPLLNPIIYCLRNKEVKEAVRKVLKKLAALARNGAIHPIM